MKKNVAVIGCGKVVPGKTGWAIGHTHAEGYLSCGHELELMGVDISADNLKHFGDKFAVPMERLFHSTEEMYGDCLPDCVSICTWPALHYPMVMEALERGVKAIICEKPFTLDVFEQRDLERRVAQAGAVLTIGHQRRLEPAFQKLKEVAVSGKLGKNLEVRGHVHEDWDILSWSCHWFDLANLIFGGPPQTVLAGMDLGTTRRYQHAVEDASIIYADYGSRGSATFLTGPGSTTEFLVCGSEGLARIGTDRIEIARFDGCEFVPFFVPEGSGFSYGYTLLMKETLAALDGGPEPLCSIRHCAVATEMAYAAQESARTRRRVAMPMATLFPPLEVVQHPIKSALKGWHILLHADAHFGSGGCEGLAEALESVTGRRVKLINAEIAGLRAEDLDDIQALVIYHTQKEADPETRNALTKWADDGKPLLIVHAGLGAWPDWIDYTRWCGKVWQWGVSQHLHEPATLGVTAGDPLRFRWSEAWLPTDEIFVKLKDTAEVEVGLTATIAGGTYPAAWTNHKFPRIGAWMPGHRMDSWRVPAMREGLARTLLAITIPL